MTELASELRMSATTLYKLYPSKEALALACIERWADDLSAAEAARRKPTAARDGFEQYLHWVDAWSDANAVLSPAFARDLRADDPLVWQRYRELVNERKRRGSALLRPLLKPGMDARIAFGLLERIFTIVLQPEFADELQVARRDAIRTAASIWAGGVPQFLRTLDHSQKIFQRSDPQVGELKLRASEYIRRQVRFTPFPGEDVGRMIKDSSPSCTYFRATIDTRKARTFRCAASRKKCRTSTSAPKSNSTARTSNT